MRSWPWYALSLLLLLPLQFATAQMTQTQYLSGRGKDDPVQWSFLCDKGQHANLPSTIGVPSNWQLQGFGIYEYGRPAPAAGGWPNVHGTYRREFTTPASWNGKTAFIDFEGVMTDTRVTVNGRSAGPVHQGGYYAFKYDITSLLRPAGEENELRVDVDSESADESVNHAERRGDYWNYAGIFRPVFLEAVPKTFVDHLAIKATAAGLLQVDVTLSDTRTSAHSGSAASVEMRVFDHTGRAVAAPVLGEVRAFDEKVRLSETVAHPRLWSAETPNLYQMEVRLKLNGAVVHIVRQRFGFRTIEVIPGHGLFVNGSRVFLKGVARHSFWPDSGRTLSEQISRDDIANIKDLNGNAVRSSHYPPDRHFLDACDELGLYVLDELAGWQAHYDTGIGRKLVREMVKHDVNHPSILFWDNGNEGGFNLDLDDEFAKYDPQERTVLHPWAAYPLGIADTKHYPTYELLQQKLAADPVFFPTEMLHGLYDGGGGAGMADYWAAILKSKAGAGGFIWSYVDEDVKRVDEGGILDSAGNRAPDGIFGPYREREGSFYAIRKIWAPIQVTASPGLVTFTVSNRYAFLNADRSTFRWELIAFRKPQDDASGSIVLASRTDHGRFLAPGQSATWAGWGPPASAGRTLSGRRPDAIRLVVQDPTGRVTATDAWPLGNLSRELARVENPPGGTTPTVEESPETLTASAGDLSLTFSKRSGLLTSVLRRGSSFPLSDGPRMVAMGPRPAAVHGQYPFAPPADFAPESPLSSFTYRPVARDMVISAKFDGPMRSVTYRLRPSGWLSVDYAYALSGPHEYFGIGFDFPEETVEGMRFLGEGPYPVYQNRVAGGTLDVWDKAFNNTVVGDPEGLKPGEHFDYPPFKGFYSGVRWIQLATSAGPVTMLIGQSRDTPTYLQILTPKTPPAALAGQTLVPYPNAGVSLLRAIPAVGSKFSGPQSTGPMGQPAIANGLYTGHLSLYFGPLP